jgi:Zn-dependent protease with chaperone function
MNIRKLLGQKYWRTLSMLYGIGFIGLQAFIVGILVWIVLMQNWAFILFVTFGTGVLLQLRRIKKPKITNLRTFNPFGTNVVTGAFRAAIISAFDHVSEADLSPGVDVAIIRNYPSASIMHPSLTSANRWRMLIGAELLMVLNTATVQAVVCHEIGHVVSGSMNNTRRAVLLSRFISSTLIISAAIFLVQGFFSVLAIAHNGVEELRVLLWVAMAIIAFGVYIFVLEEQILGMVLRMSEFAADEYAAGVLGHEVVIAMLDQLKVTGVSQAQTLEHPSTKARIEALKQAQTL